MMMRGRDNGKRLMATRILKHAFATIHLLTRQKQIAGLRRCREWCSLRILDLHRFSWCCPDASRGRAPALRGDDGCRLRLPPFAAMAVPGYFGRVPAEMVKVPGVLVTLRAAQSPVLAHCRNVRLQSATARVMRNAPSNRTVRSCALAATNHVCQDVWD